MRKHNHRRLRPALPTAAPDFDKTFWSSRNRTLWAALAEYKSGMEWHAEQRVLLRRIGCTTMVGCTNDCARPRDHAITR